jgi:hypothetical protein
LFFACASLIATSLGARSPAEMPPTLDASPRVSLAMVGIVLPRDVAPGEPFRATVVRNADSYASVPGLRVVEVVAPLSKDPSGRPSLEGLLVDCGSGRSEAVASGIACAAAPGTAEIGFALFRSAEERAVARASAPSEPRREPPASFALSPICVAGSVQVIEGPFADGFHATRLEVGGRPATVIAQSARAHYWALPAGTPEGESRAILRSGSRFVSLPIWIVRLAMTADRLSLERGESTPFHAMLSGLESVPESAWLSGPPAELVDAERIERLAPGFRPPRGGEPGLILLAIENGSRGAIALENSVDERIVIPVSRRDLHGGVFRYDGVIRSRRAGSFAVSASAVPLLSVVAGEDLPASQAFSRASAALRR